MADIPYSKVESELKHYGVKGMKWGVRRAASNAAKAEQRARDSSSDAKEAQRIKTKIKETGLHSLTNAEMRSYTERINLEKQYAKLSEGDRTPTQRTVNFLLKNGAEIAVNVGKAYATQQLKTALGVKVKK